MATELRPAGPVPVRDLYLDLVRTFPLRPLRSEEDHERAIAAVDALSDRRSSLRPEEHDYMVVLALLIERYEDGLYPVASELDDPANGPR